MLVVDAYALQPVNFLNFVHEVLGEGLLTQDRKISCGLAAPSMRASPALNWSVSRTEMCLPLGISIPSAHHAQASRSVSLTLAILTKRDDTVDFTDGSDFLRLSGLKEFRNAWKTSGDVLCLRGFSRNLRYRIAREDLIAVKDGDIRTDRQQIGGFCRLAFTQNNDTRSKSVSRESIMTRRLRPVTSSTCSDTTDLLEISTKEILPGCSVSTGTVYGSQVANGLAFGALRRPGRSASLRKPTDSARARDRFHQEPQVHYYDSSP